MVYGEGRTSFTVKSVHGFQLYPLSFSLFHIFLCEANHWYIYHIAWSRKVFFFVTRLTNEVLHSYGNKLFFLEYALENVSE